MQNWEVLQKKISEMTKDEFITFAREKLFCETVRNMLGMDAECSKCKFTCANSLVCKKNLLEDEYQPSKQEKWIVHRTLRKQNKEIYIGTKNAKFTQHWLCVFTGKVPTTYEKESSFKHDFYNAVILRDELNKDRVGKQYLSVISRVEE